MASCTFFGHRDCPSSIKEKLYEEIERLISHHGVDTFYIGTQGSFDRMASLPLNLIYHICYPIPMKPNHMLTQRICTTITQMIFGIMRMRRNTMIVTNNYLY